MTAAFSSGNSPRCDQLVNRSTSPLGRLPIPWAETAYPPASARPYRAPAPRAIFAIRSCRGSIVRRLRGRGDAADLSQDREPLLPGAAELGREPQQRPQPPQYPLVQVRVQVLRAGCLDQDGAVQVNDPARRVQVVDSVTRPVQVRRQLDG